ncbi:damage-control phosphatase ARMT1 isoform X1 [Leucoraja erinacea]|uniref:damage-control phosphatase ARMT1 isoform X1 n=1 Tax=Leucoraja erinaceus TaxID=7782 RepID=UPI00245637AC|nr:damage-control phosphatase ARMT1 isoform X1 [Leucoraja erinacea]
MAARQMGEAASAAEQEEEGGGGGEEKEVRSEVPDSLSGKYTGSFAYLTITERLPYIVTKAVDTLHRHTDTFFAQYGQEGVEAEKAAIGLLSKLRNELQTDKPVLPLTDGFPDAAQWNKYLEQQQARLGSEENTSWFKAPWLYVECYMYRRIHEALLLNPPMCDFDVFNEAKTQGFMESQEAIIAISTHLQKVNANVKCFKETELKAELQRLLQVSLWGNRCDLSISAGVANSQKLNPLTTLDSLKPLILVDDFESVWCCLINSKRKGTSETACTRVDIVLDNSGFELVADLILADFLITSQLADEIHFHGKSIPWYVSDTTKTDFDWTLKQMKTSCHLQMSCCGVAWENNVTKGVWIYQDHPFWTFPHAFCDMSLVANDLYAELQKSNLIFFKGDLNYRKLTGDRRWNYSVPFETALRGFQPAPLCSLRTLKADIQVGLKPGLGEQLAASEPDWMTTGHYAVIQFNSPLRK